MSSTEPEKLKLSAYELMSFLGATQPCLSLRLKAALDEELTDPKYGVLEAPEALGLALRNLAQHRKEAFDLTNRDDTAAFRLSPILFLEDGSRRPTEELLKLVEPDSVQVVERRKGDRLLLDVTAEDETGAMTASMEAKTIPGTPETDPDVPIVHHYHSNPVDREIDERLRRLKEKVLDATDFHVPFTWFMDQFVDDPQFIKQGKLVSKAPNLQAALRLVSRRLFPKGDHRVKHLMLCHLKRHDFLHGSAEVSGRVTLLFYFQDLGFGMAAFRELDNHTVIYSRITMMRQKH
jgi:hypothetical protein